QLHDPPVVEPRQRGEPFHLRWSGAYPGIDDDDFAPVPRARDLDLAFALEPGVSVHHPEPLAGRRKPVLDALPPTLHHRVLARDDGPEVDSHGLRVHAEPSGG